jgi:hypothetical protein
MNVLGRVTSSLAHDYVLAFGIPFEHGSRTYAELSPNLSRNRNLALGGNLGVRRTHKRQITRVMAPVKVPMAA